MWSLNVLGGRIFGLSGKAFVCAEAAEKANPQAAVSIYLFI